VPYNYHLMFRKTFTVRSLPVSARIHITASDKYRLCVNGRYVGRGPARNAGPFWTSYDTHDITKLVREGNNTIAVHGYYYGCPTVWSSDMPPGLWAEAEMLSPDGRIDTVVSDGTWKVKRLEGYHEETQRINGWQGPIEVYCTPPRDIQNPTTRRPPLMTTPGNRRPSLPSRKRSAGGCFQRFLLRCRGHTWSPGCAAPA